MQKNIFLIVLASLVIGGFGGYIVTQNLKSTSMATKKPSDSIPAGMHRMPDGSLMSDGGNTSDTGMMHGMDHS
jgi:hypothetical protein